MLYMYTCFRYWYVNIVKYDFRYPCSQRYCYIYIVYIYCCIHMYKGSGPSYHCIRPPQFIPLHIFARILTFIYIYILYVIIFWNSVLPYDIMLRYIHTVYTFIFHQTSPIVIPQNSMFHIYLLNTISPHYSPFLLVKSSEFPLKLAISVVLLWKKPIETSSPFFGWLKPCWNPINILNIMENLWRMG